MTKSVYEDLIKVLKRRPSQTEWDDDLEREYTVVTQSMSDETGLAIIKRIVMECEMRPVSATLVRFAREITGDTKSEIKALGSAQKQAYRDIRADPLYRELKAAGRI